MQHLKKLDKNLIVPKKSIIVDPVLNVSVRGFRFDNVASDLIFSRAYVTEFITRSLKVKKITELSMVSLLVEIKIYHGWELDLIGDNVEFIGPDGTKKIITICNTNLLELLRDSIVGLNEKFNLKPNSAKRIIKGYENMVSIHRGEHR